MRFTGKRFRGDGPGLSLLFPPPLHDWPPDNRRGRFLANAVCALDLEAAHSSCGEKDGRGMSAYAPATMARVLL